MSAVPAVSRLLQSVARCLEEAGELELPVVNTAIVQPVTLKELMVEWSTRKMRIGPPGHRG